MMEKLWTRAEVAKCLGINEADVEGLMREGKLTGYKLGGQFLRFRPDQVQALKGQIKFRPSTAKAVRSANNSWTSQLHDFMYFYDFYIVSAILLTVLVVYLIASSG